MIQRLFDVFYYVSNMPTSVAFYRDLLGMRVIPEDSDESWTTFAIGDQPYPGSTPFCIMLTGEGLPVPRSEPQGSNWVHSGATVSLGVDDLVAEVARLRAAGVNFPVDNSQGEGYKVAMLADPDGNLVLLLANPKSALE